MGIGRTNDRTTDQSARAARALSVLEVLSEAGADLVVESDEGEAIAYTHAHMPFAGHEQPMRVRHLMVEERSSDLMRLKNYRGVERLFHRCPSDALKAPEGRGGH